MAKVDLTVQVTELIHTEIAEYVRLIYEKHGLMLNHISIEWATDMGIAMAPDARLTGIRIQSEQIMPKPRFRDKNPIPNDH